jgi:asparagine synthase (glutamine-hydrolysing)
MCGIAGIWKQSDEAIVAKMTQSVAHRGPDGVDWLTISSSSLGASRLAIKGDQNASAIFYDAESNVAVMLNGEIYNIEAIRADLAKTGCKFHTDLESEVISELYKREGLDFAAQLKGMFAIAILDGDQLVLARDRFGIKPLYYSRIGNRVLFGSEIKAILAHPEFKAKLYLPALEEISVFGYIYSLNKTLFEGITQVEPGTVVAFYEDKQTCKRFWQAPQARYFNPTRHPTLLDAVGQLRSQIIKTMEMLLSHGDHAVGIYLSGGLDSTILTLVAHAILGYPVTTFTLSDTSETADLLAAREVAKKLGTQHIERRVTVEDYFNRLKHFVRHYEAIVAGGVFDIHGNVAFHLLSETVSEHVKVALSGEGADELFGGYYWFYTHPLGFADGIRNRLHQLNPNGDGVSRILNNLFPLPENEHVYRSNVFDTLMRGGLANYHLQSVDRSAGAFGFEIRPAYLFDDLATFALSLPIEYKVPSKQVTKWILREAFRPELEQLDLDWVVTRLKEGMPAAVSSLAPVVNQRIEDSISDSSLTRHPFKKYLRSKFDMYLFDIFAEIFLPEAINAIQDCTTQ